MGKLDYYKALLNNTYSELVKLLLDKYGKAKDDYYSEKSYERFLNGEIKNITRRKFSRTDDGLYCHHIDEIEHLNLSDKYWIEKNRYDFKYQKKDRLVYCDLNEHLILHALIAKETDCINGFSGYEVFIKELVIDWFIYGNVPEPNWMKNCYNKAFLTKEEAKELLEYIDNTALKEIREAERIIEEEKIKKYEIENKKREKEYEKYKKEQEIIRKKEQEKKEKMLSEFRKKYPLLATMNVYPGATRTVILKALYDIKYKNEFTKKELRLKFINLYPDELLELLKSIVDEKVIE